MRHTFFAETRRYELVDWSASPREGRALPASAGAAVVRAWMADQLSTSSLRWQLVEADPDLWTLPQEECDLRERLAASVADGRLVVWEHRQSRPTCTITPGEGEDAEPIDDEPTDTSDESQSPDAGTEAEVADVCVWSLEAKFDDLGEDEDDVFEGAVLHLEGKVLQGECEETEAHFVLLRGGQEVARETVDPSSGEVSFDYTTEDVPEPETSYPLTYRMEVGGESYPGTLTFDVWAKVITLRVTQSESGQPMSNFKFKVTQEDAEQEAVTDEEGSVEHELEKPAAFALEAQAPCEVVEWTRDSGRVRECTGIRRYEAEFVAPVPPENGDPFEQLTNLPTEDHGRDQQSSLVTVQVAGKGDADKAAADRLGAEGDRIYVQVTFGRESKRNSPAPELKGATAVEKSADGRVHKGYVELGAEGGAAEFQVELGHAGGDTCEVKIGTTAVCGDATLKFINWRKVYYQVTRPDSMTAPPMSRITDCLAAVFVRYEEYGHVTLAEAEAGTPAGSWFDGEMMGMSGRCLNIGDHNKAFFHQKFDDTKTPLGVHVLFCHKQFDGGDPAHQTTLDVELAPEDECELPLGSETYVPGFTGFMSDINDSGNLFPLALQDGLTSIRGVTWRSLASSGEHQGKNGAIADDHIGIDYVDYSGEFSIKLPSDAAEVLKAGQKVKLRYTVLWSLGEYLGESDGTHGNWQLIAKMVESSTNDVMAHELGHTIGQVANNPAPGLSGSDHNWQYTGRGHQGSHCAFGADSTVFSDSSQNLGGISECKCIMYGENSGSGSRSTGVFCEVCSPFLKGQELRSVT